MSNIDNLGRFGEITKDMKAAGGVDAYLGDIRREGRVEAGIPALAIGLGVGWGISWWSRRRAAKAEAALRAIDADACPYCSGTGSTYDGADGVWRPCTARCRRVTRARTDG